MTEAIVPSHEQGPTDTRGVLVWRFPDPVEVLSSASVAGGRRRADWLVNIGVPLAYGRTDLDAHVAEVADELRLSGPGVALLTAADVRKLRTAKVDGVRVDTTVGISKPTWAADPEGGWSAWTPGTINIVVQLPVALDDGAAVNAVITATEAKTQALVERGVPGTGTASDAVAVVWKGDDPVRFAGPRSVWGDRIARAVHATVGAGVDGFLDTGGDE